MIHGVGTDIAAVSRLAALYDKHGERATEKLLAPAEFEAFDRASDKGRFLAKRFAAKEALVKALGTGFRFGVGPRDIGVRHDPLGRPYLVFSAVAQGLLDARGVAESHLSLADEEDLAVAFVTLLRQPRSTSP